MIGLVAIIPATALFVVLISFKLTISRGEFPLIASWFNFIGRSLDE